MKLEKFKEKDRKKISVIVFTLICVFLVVGVILYRTFAIFEVKTNQNIINGNVQSGDILFTFYKEDEDGNYVITDTIPEESYVFNASESYCGVAGNKDENITVSMSADKTLEIIGLSKPSTKCKLYFEKWKSPFDNPKETVDENGNGLYAVEHSASETNEMNIGWQATEYRFAGVNYNESSPETPYVHNYVWFNSDDGCTSEDGTDGKHCEKWRIIGLVNVLVIQPGGSKKVEQRLKIIRDKPESKAWDSGNVNDWTNASLMKDFNEAGGEFYQTLTADAMKMIDKNIIWNLGGISYSDYQSLKANGWYEKERGTTGGGAAPNTTEWPMPNSEGKYEVGKALVGLMYPSDYGYAVGGGKAMRDTCLTTALHDYDTCADNDWLFLKSTEWLLSPPSPDSSHAFYVYLSGYAGFYGYRVSYSYSVRPVVYLTSKVKISGGTGEHGNPYTLSGN